MRPGFRNVGFLIVFSSGNNENCLAPGRKRRYDVERSRENPAANGRKKERMMKKPMVILLTVILLLVLVSCACSVSGYTYSDSKRYTAGNAEVTGKVRTIDINWIDGQVNIGLHDGDGVIVKETSGKDLDKEERLRWYLKDGTLYIKYAESGFRSAKSLDKKLTVLLPEDLTLTKLTIDAVSAKTTVTDITAGKLEINTVSGGAKLQLHRVDSEQINSVSGAVSIKADNAMDRITVDTVSGSVTLRLPGDEGFEAAVDTVSGDVDCEGCTVKGKQYVAGDRKCDVQVDTVSGNIHLYAE